MLTPEKLKSMLESKGRQTTENLKKNIRVIFKFRGGEDETENLGTDELELRSSQRTVVFEGRTYTYSEVLGPNTTQFETYQKSCQDVVRKVLDGYNGTIFVYGNSGSGKTFSMLGPESVVDYLSSTEMKNQQIDSKMAESFGIILRA